jgi:hypothetical protein
VSSITPSTSTHSWERGVILHGQRVLVHLGLGLSANGGRRYRTKFRRYVEEFARPTITGIGPGQKLQIIWPGAGWSTSGPRTDRAELLPLMAALFSERMVEFLMSVAEHETSGGAVPIKDRAARIAVLEAELAELFYIEEVLIVAALANGADVQRSANAPPEAILGVRIVAPTKSSRTA